MNKKHACGPAWTAGQQRRLTSWQYCRMPSLVPMQVLVPDGSDSHFPFCTFMCMFSLPQNMATWGSASRPALPSVGTWKRRFRLVTEIHSSGVEAGGRAMTRNMAWWYAKNSSILGNSQLSISVGKALCVLAFPGSSDGKESACIVGDLGLIPGSGRCPREGNGYLLQYSCLENSMDRAAWWATVHGVAKSRTGLSD